MMVAIGGVGAEVTEQTRESLVLDPLTGSVVDVEDIEQAFTDGGADSAEEEIWAVVAESRDEEDRHDRGDDSVENKKQVPDAKVRS